MRHAIEQCLAQALGIRGELNLGGEMFAGLQLRSQAADCDSDDEVGREGERIFEFRDVQGEERRDEQEIPGQRAERCDQENRAAVENHSREQHSEKVDERDGCVTG